MNSIRSGKNMKSEEFNFSESEINQLHPLSLSI